MAFRRRRSPGAALTWLVLLAIAWVGVSFGARQVARHFYPIRYKALIWEQAEKYGLSPFLVLAVIRVESGWRPDAVSNKGAQGLMQLMPDTAAWALTEMGLQAAPAAGSKGPGSGPAAAPAAEPGAEPGAGAADYRDPELNIRIGTWYLAHLRDRFDGQMVAALAAYNGGEHNVRRWLGAGWSATDGAVAEIPFPETRQYVQRVLTDRRRYQALYGSRPEESAHAALR